MLVYPPGGGRTGSLHGSHNTKWKVPIFFLTVAVHVADELMGQGISTRKEEWKQ
jgi:hypothetical protein